MMVVSRLQLAAVAVLIVGCLVVQTPARLITHVLPDSVQLEGVTGTLWTGAAARAAVTINDKRFMLGKVHWQLKPLSLLALKMAAQINTEWGSQRLSGRVAVSLGGAVELSEFSAATDLRFLRSLLPLYVGGQLRAEITRAQFEDQQWGIIEARLVWQDAVWAARQGDVALGNYVLTLSGEDADIEGEVITLSGPLVAEGRLELLERDWQVALNLSGPATQHEGLRPSLALFGVATDAGFSVELDGSL